MKKILLIISALFLITVFNNSLYAAASTAEKPVVAEKISAHKKSQKELRKQKKWQKRLDKMSQKIKKRMERLKKKGKMDANLNLGIVGLIVMALGGLFIVLGLIIPAIGIVFTILGVIIAFVGLILLLLLGGINVNASSSN